MDGDDVRWDDTITSAIPPLGGKLGQYLYPYAVANGTVWGAVPGGDLAPEVPHVGNS